MDKDYFNSRKYLILIILICGLLALLTAKVFDYMPQPTDESPNYNGYYPYPNQNLQNYPNDITNKNTYANEVSDEDDEADDDNDNDNEIDNENETENNINDSQHKSGHIDFMPKSAYSNDTDITEIPAPPGTVEEQVDVVDTN